jgi:hypothetical protein
MTREEKAMRFVPVYHILLTVILKKERGLVEFICQILGFGCVWIMDPESLNMSRGIEHTDLTALITCSPLGGEVGVDSEHLKPYLLGSM